MSFIAWIHILVCLQGWSVNTWRAKPLLEEPGRGIFSYFIITVIIFDHSRQTEIIRGNQFRMWTKQTFLITDFLWLIVLTSCSGCIGCLSKESSPSHTKNLKVYESLHGVILKNTFGSLLEVRLVPSILAEKKKRKKREFFLGSLGIPACEKRSPFTDSLLLTLQLGFCRRHWLTSQAMRHVLQISSCPLSCTRFFTSLDCNEVNPEGEKGKALYVDQGKRVIYWINNYIYIIV